MDGEYTTTDTTGLIACQEFASSHPSLRPRITLLQSLLAFTFLE
jgi:Zn-dependent protease with chaperone function